MDTRVTQRHLLIYKGKFFIGSFGCRNDCLAVHFICHKRRDSGVHPPNPLIMVSIGIIPSVYRIIALL
jgi:hypothetical protein